MLKQDLRNYKFPIALDSQLCSKLDKVTDIEIYDSAQEDNIPENQTIMNKWDNIGCNDHKCTSVPIFDDPRLKDIKDGLRGQKEASERGNEHETGSNSTDPEVRFEILDLIKDLHTPLDILLEKISDWKTDDGKAHLKFADDVLGMNIKN